MGRRVRELDGPVLAEPDDPDAHEIGQVGRVADLLIELELRGVEAVAQPPDEGRDVGPVVGRQRASGAAVEARGAGRDRRPDRVERPFAIEGDPDRDGQDDGEEADERDEDPVHAIEDRTGLPTAGYAVAGVARRP